jgi:CBS domain-containing protein
MGTTMKVQDVMTTEVYSCGPEATLAAAARCMWERDCGIVPIVDGGGHLVGVLTDRDLCMAAYTQGRALDALRISHVMSGETFTCSADEPLNAVFSRLADRQVRRLPVVDGAGKLVGMLSLNDLARACLRVDGDRERRRLETTFVEALAAVCEPRAGGARAEIAPALPRAGAPADEEPRKEKGKTRARPKTKR